MQGSRWPSLFGLLYVTSLATASAVGVLPERFALYGLAVLALSWGQYRRWRTRGGLLVRERLIASSVVAGLLGPIDAVSAVLLASVVSGRKRQVVSERVREMGFTGVASLGALVLVAGAEPIPRALAAITLWWVLYAALQRAGGRRLTETRSAAFRARVNSGRLEIAVSFALGISAAGFSAAWGSVVVPLTVGMLMAFSVSWISMAIHDLRERNAREVTRFQTLAASVASCLVSRHGVDAQSPTRVAALAHAIGLSYRGQELALAVEEAALLKNIGLLALSTEVLERSAGERTPVGVQLPATCAVLRNVPLSESVRSAILHQHERWDGRGQPQGLMRNDIPASAQVLAAAAALDRMLASSGGADEVARCAFESMAARELDPGLVSCVLQNWQKIVAAPVDSELLFLAKRDEQESPLAEALRTRLDAERVLFREVRQVLSDAPVLEKHALDSLVALLRRKIPVHALAIVDASVDDFEPLVITTRHFDGHALASLIYTFDTVPDTSERFVIASIPGESATLIIELDGPCPRADARLLVDVLARMLRPNVVARRATEAVKSVAFLDALTQLGNRRAFDEEQPKMLGRARATDTPFSVLLVDADDLKKVNDTWGHETGDMVLKRLADVLRGMLRGDDSAARIGGDEFVVLLEACDAAGARLVMERVFAGLEANPVQLPNGEPYVVRASIGTAVWPDDADRMQDLRELADRRMYAAKKANKACRGDLPRHQLTSFDA